MGLFGHDGWLSKAGHAVEKGVDSTFDFIQDEIIGNANKAVGWNEPGDGPNMDVHVGTSTPIIDEKTQQAINTTAYMENGGINMIGSNTAYNEEPQQDKSWWERNSDWMVPLLTTVGTTAAGMIYNNYQNKKNNGFNAEQAQINRDYQTEMANTAHQREMADLLATGLNPVNTATGSGGATTPGGAQGSSVGAPYAGHSDMANTALSLAETMKVLNENKYISKEKKAQIANTIADTTNKSANTEMTHANTNLIKEQAKQINIDNITREDMNRIEMALKSNQSAETLQNTIEKAISNAYKLETGELPEQSWVTKVATIATSIIDGHKKDGKPIDPIKAMRKAVQEIMGNK